MSDSNASNSSAGAGAGGSGGPCGACKFLRRKCAAGCIFAPYFDSDQGPAHFAAVHKVFGASNFSKLLHHIPVHRRPDAVVSVCYEARARLGDPVYGCVAHICALQQQVVNLQAELSYLQAHLSAVEPSSPPPPPPPPSSLSIEDLPTSSLEMPTTYDLSSLFMDPAEAHPLWTTLRRRREVVDAPPHLLTSSMGSGDASSSANSGDGDLQQLARELLNKTVSWRKNQPPNLPPHTR